MKRATLYDIWKNLIAHNLDFNRDIGDPTWQIYAMTIREMAMLIWSMVVCRFKGHDLDEELLSVEDGHSVLYCHRCGLYQSIWM